MQIYHHVDEYKQHNGSVVTLGTFDGVHRGHHQLINQLIKIAVASNCAGVVLTFHPHPRMVIFPDDHGLQLLNTLEEKIEIFRQFGIQHLIIQPFTLEFSRLDAVHFVRDILVQKLKVQKLIIGHDHHFGRNRQGNLTELEELAPIYNFEVLEVEGFKDHDTTVSSTKIRNALLAGNVELAETFLGYKYALSGIVVHGKKLGRTLGFPTANLQLHDATKLIPAIGVYAVTVAIYEDEKDVLYNNHFGMLSIGKRPTFDNGEVSIEVNILNFNKDIYGKNITVQLHKKLRDDKKFDSSQSLIEQMNNDKADTETFFNLK